MSTTLAQLLEADHKYYNLGSSGLSDAEYDFLKEKFKKENPSHPYCTNVGASAIGKKVKHRIPAGSQEKLTSADEITSWAHQIPGALFTVGYKEDGSTLVLSYVDGVLVEAATRGDGVEGESVLPNVLLMSSVPKTLPVPVSIEARGEAVLYKEDFDKYFAPLGHSNARNSVACIRDQKGTNLAKHLNFVAFDIFSSDYSPVTLPDRQAFTEIDNHEILTYLGFNAVKTEFNVPADKIAEVHAKFESEKDSNPSLTDGSIVRYQCLAHQASLGMATGLKPKGQRCIKWENDQAETTVIGNVLTMGSTGAIIPTIKLNTVVIGGVEVSSVLGNNFGYVRKKGIAIGDKVMVSRRGGVIPHIESVIEQGSERKIIEMPKECPWCGTETVLKESESKGEDSAALYCPNEECEGRGVQKVKAWIKKTNILHIGDVLLNELYTNYGITEPNKLYGLTEVTLRNVQVGGSVYGANAKRTMAEIEKSKSLPLHVFVGSLCIKFMGREEAKNIMEKLAISSLEGFFAITENDLLSVSGYKEKKATGIVLGLKNAKEEADALLAAGVRVFVEEAKEEAPVPQEGEAKLSGSFCFTGPVQKADEAGNRYTRKMLQALVLANGGSVAEDVKAGTTYLVQADPSSSSSKTKAAAKYGTKVISEENFFEMLSM